MGGIDKSAIKILEDLVAIQSSNGNWNYDPYMHGMANGLICALASIKNEEANYLEAPNQWLCDTKEIVGGVMTPIENSTNQKLKQC